MIGKFGIIHKTSIDGKPWWIVYASTWRGKQFVSKHRRYSEAVRATSWYEKNPPQLGYVIK